MKSATIYWLQNWKTLSIRSMAKTQAEAIWAKIASEWGEAKAGITMMPQSWHCRKAPHFCSCKRCATMWGTSKHHVKPCIFVRCLAPGCSRCASFFGVTYLCLVKYLRISSRMRYLKNWLFASKSVFKASRGALSQTHARGASQGASDSTRLSLQISYL